MLTRSIGPQTQLIITLRADFCTSGSWTVLPSAKPIIILLGEKNRQKDYYGRKYKKIKIKHAFYYAYYISITLRES